MSNSGRNEMSAWRIIQRRKDPQQLNIKTCAKSYIGGNHHQAKTKKYDLKADKVEGMQEEPRDSRPTSIENGGGCRSGPHQKHSSTGAREAELCRVFASIRRIVHRHHPYNTFHYRPITHVSCQDPDGCDRHSMLSSG